MTDTGLAGSEHYSFTSDEDASRRFELGGVKLCPGHYELIEGQLHLMQQAVDEGVAARYVYQLEGVLLTLRMMEEISQADAEALRGYIQGKLSNALASLVSVP
ncbi:hypothetical protein BTW15_27735 [Pseudomonas syringae pv. tomato]|uniref:Uncharacterized protein n=4 Tax=Pseudomonas TaxID=286 RepID=I3W2K8_PSESX|nr:MULTISPECIES: hypothetical protein [Pseudomonas]AFK89835.1 hypothetical protein [Pseudomonas syringae]KPB78028.1 Uncharacterized protein AC505_2127 [Pseudomonas syringae pv. maculicola]MBX6511289.1 hypothetical protein [Pseudomonas syringae pv. tomato]OPE56843.1 hypothetical protein BTW15_27735 [Pseudomonas syringae pv. tomato]RMQ19650.1 hypothetical protein ALQ08_00413 [Pseudomonas syringae pv. delphinii]